MEELGKNQENSRLYCDSESAIHLANNSAFHSKTKNIQLRYHFIQSSLEDGHLKLEKLHIKITHFDSVTSVVIVSVASVAFCSQVSQVSRKAYCHDAYVVPIMTSRRHLTHIKHLIWKRRND
jgi:hypothetical protein